MTVDEIYLNIGQSIISSLDKNNWENAKLKIDIVGDGVVGYSGEFQINNEYHDLSVRKIPREIKSWIRELHSITTEGGNNKWNRAIFTLTPDRKFDMEFIWDQALQDEVEDLAKT